LEGDLSENIKNFTLDELKKEFEKLDEKPYRAQQVYEWIYKKKVNSFDEMTNISKDLRDKLKDNFNLGLFNIVRKLESKDGTKKYLFDINDDKGSLIESVLMQYHHGYTVCVSSEIGCPMGCKFCASTGIKFERGLFPGEIIEQIMAIEKDSNVTVSNIVFMGIGEPFDNYDNVMKAIKILNDPKALNIGARHISISTSGIVPKIYQM
jgi:23S rRNA (adenine2503-C2)-methyltransferase